MYLRLLNMMAQNPLDVHPYIKNGLVFCLFGKAGVSNTKWTELINGHEFMVQGGATPDANGGFKFSSSGDYLDAGVPITLPDYSQQSTIEIAMKPTSNVASPIITLANNRAYVYYSSSDKRFIRDMNWSGMVNGAVPDITNVRYLAMRYQGVNAHILNYSYLDYSYGNAGDNNTPTARLARVLGNNQFYGTIYAIRIYNRLLDNEELLYNRKKDNGIFNLGL